MVTKIYTTDFRPCVLVTLDWQQGMKLKAVYPPEFKDAVYSLTYSTLKSPAPSPLIVHPRQHRLNLLLNRFYK